MWRNPEEGGLDVPPSVNEILLASRLTLVNLDLPAGVTYSTGGSEATTERALYVTAGGMSRQLEPGLQGKHRDRFDLEQSTGEGTGAEYLAHRAKRVPVSAMQSKKPRRFQRHPRRGAPAPEMAYEMIPGPSGGVERAVLLTYCFGHALYRISDGRHSAPLKAQLTVPESIADSFLSEAGQEPVLIRQLAAAAVMSNVSITVEQWDGSNPLPTAKPDDAKGIGPPYHLLGDDWPLTLVDVDNTATVAFEDLPRHTIGRSV